MNTSDTTSQSIFGNSPNDWVVDRIRDRLDTTVGGEWGDDPDANDEGVEIPVIRVADIRGLDVKTEDLTIRRVKESKLPGRLIGKRTILLEKSGGGEQKPVGRAVLGRKIDFDAICSNFMAKTDCGENVDPLYIAFLLDAAYSCGVNMAHIQQTTGIQNLRVTHYLNTHVAFPPLAEQQRIAAYIDASCAAIDAAVDAKRNQLDTLDALRKSIIQHTITEGISSTPELIETHSQIISAIPNGWRLERLKDIADIRYGLGQPPDEQADGVKMIRATNINAGRITEQDMLIVDRDALPLDRKPYLKEGEIIVVRSGAYTGDSAIIPQQYAGAVAGYDMVVAATRAEPKFIAFGLLSDYILKGQMLLLTLRAAQPHLNAEELGSIVFALPPSRAEQNAIVSFLDNKLAEINLIESNIESQIEILVAYRKSLIHECVTGQRRISEADLKRAQAHDQSQPSS